MCSPAGVCLQFGEDVERVFGIPTTYNQPGPGGVFLGSVGDQAHATRKSSHNCAPMQEDPVDGVAYHPNFAHAWDARPASKQIGEAMRAATLKDPRCRYVLYDNVGTKPNGERWTLDHPTFHVSFLPGTHDDLQPFFGEEADEVTKEDLDKIREMIQNNADKIADRVADAIAEGNKAQTSAIRRAVWTAQGKTKAEIDELEAKLGD